MVLSHVVEISFRVVAGIDTPTSTSIAMPAPTLATIASVDSLPWLIVTESPSRCALAQDRIWDLEFVMLRVSTRPGNPSSAHCVLSGMYPEETEDSVPG